MTNKNPRLRTMSIGGATFDLFVHTDHSVVHELEGKPAFTLPLGTKIRVESIKGLCGGGACNTSVGLARLGFDAHFCGIVGNDQWGQELLATMKRENVCPEFVTVVENETSSFSVLLMANTGERVTLYEPGVNAHLDDVTFAKEDAAKMDWVVLNHLNRESCEIEDDVAAMLATLEGPKLMWNPGGCQIDRGFTERQNQALLKHTDILLVNRDEAFKFTGETSIPSAMKALNDAGAVIVCLTDGKDGAYATTKTETQFCPSMATEVVDTTGAGDAFGTGFMWAIASGKNLPIALKAGTINARNVVSAIGAQTRLLTSSEMESELAKPL